MLEIIDKSIPLILAAFEPELTTDIIYASKSFALRLRQEKNAQLSPAPNVLPFISYYRTDHKVTWFRQGLSKRGIPFDKNSSNEGILTLTPVQPVQLTYEVLFWEKDAIKINSWLKTFYGRYLRVQNVTVFVDDSISYRLTVRLGKPVDGFYTGKGESKDSRDSFAEVGQMFLFSFNIDIFGVIPDKYDQTSKFRIEVVKLNYAMQKEILKQEFTVDSVGTATQIL